MTTPAEAVGPLLEQLARGQLLLLVGAGASRWAGFPSWREVAAALAEDIVPALRTRVPGARRRFERPRPGAPWPVEELVRIAEVHRALCGEARLVARLAELFDTRRVDPAALPLHAALVRLSRFVPAIYTTNFDDLLERAFEHARRPWQVVATAEDLRAWRLDPAGRRHVARFPIYKLHGTLAHPESLVLGESDFQRRSDLAAHPIDLRFCSDVVGRELLLVGYGFHDPNLRSIWTKLRDLAVPPTGWFLEPGVSTDLQEVSFGLAGVRRVDLEAADPDRPAELLAFVTDLAARCEAELA